MPQAKLSETEPGQPANWLKWFGIFMGRYYGCIYAT